ncbi:Diaminopimelate epimerase 1 [Nitrospira sp. KM1]|uniref:diaminopimelate epimerase n=1 Tax=Nitrospira sp. KM1 TaxID=1936990 RepID=UPI0013A78915|nr:diaminopimelate epimerase [Nitrospira sp. KM1]BCA55737.1 Diaminopimelate epimerase 1 [Nitrospira sp. KM1]
MKNGFFRGHGLGNDYLVMDPKELTFALKSKTVALICNRHWGLGSDGILVPVPSKSADFGLRIFNPDGSEAEKSGNGLRIFARYLHATGRTKKTHFTVETKGGLVTVDLHLDARRDASSVTVEMGRATFSPGALPCTLRADELIRQPIQAAGRSLNFTGVSVGNPHCVVFKSAGQSWTREDLLALGPALEHHSIFPRRTNVQLAVPTGPKKLFILIWERGAGETQASGSSSCAAASAAVRLGLVKSPVRVDMPGGSLNIDVAPDFDLTMTGPVAEVARGTLSASFLRALR